MPLTHRIRRVVEDLKAIQSMLDSYTVDGEPEQKVDELDLELIQQFKSAVDNMRQSLWNYLETAASSHGADPRTSLQAFRMRRATEMLRVLEAPFQDMRRQAIPEAESFIAQVTRIATLAIEKHDRDEDNPLRQ